MSRDDETALADDPLWFKDAVIYELHVRSFADSNGDGIGDFRGLIGGLDYLQDLGVTALWLLPFYPSPLRDDGYDIADYTAINPSYGTLRDFRRFLKEAHRRGIRVITELVVNHTSNEHAWFQRARRAPPGSPQREFYVWSDSPDRYAETRVIFQDFETSNWTWDPVAKAYFWHRFYSHQPDLNFDNEAVQQALLKVLDFWLGMGVDGLRLDAVPYLFEREGTNCENLPETHDFLRRLRAHVDRRFRNRMLLAEANQWPEDAAAYFGEGDECHMNFHFPLMPRIFMALQRESSHPVLDILEQTPEIPGTCQWALFLRNHDELTLEMVTDEDRDFMYRVYAEDPQARLNLGIRRRLNPLVQSRATVELLHGLLLSMPGTPVLYYGDEIGMGDNIYLGDRNGVRTPMQWSGDRNAGFSRANPQKLFLPVIIDPEYHYESVNVEAQQNNTFSMLWWIKRLVALRRQHPVFGRGGIDFLHSDNHKVIAYVRHLEDDRVLVVANLSRFTQVVELDLAGYQGLVPVEMLGRTQFPRVGEHPYFLSLGPQGFYWLALQQQIDEVPVLPAVELPTVRVTGSWTDALRGRARERFARHLPAYLEGCRWFRGKSRRVRGVTVADVLEVPGEAELRILILEVDYYEDEPETYLLPTALVDDERRRELDGVAGALIVHLEGSDGSRGWLCDAVHLDEFATGLRESMVRRRIAKGDGAQLVPETLRGVRSRLRGGDEELGPWRLAVQQTNSSIGYGDRFVLKLFRRIEEGINPDLEMSRFLTERAHCPHVPDVAGWFVLRRRNRPEAVVGILLDYVPNEGDAWSLALETIDRYFELALEHAAAGGKAPLQHGHVLEHARRPVPPEAEEVVAFLPEARLLGQRTAELHLALSSDHEDPEFRPEGLTRLYQRSMYQAARTQLDQSFRKLQRGLRSLPEEVRPAAEAALGRRSVVDGRLRRIVSHKLDAQRIRCHGDYHLGQVLYTGSDFHVIDFEGEPARTLGERRIKRNPLRDVSGMLRSFHYAARYALEYGTRRAQDVPQLEDWASAWVQWVSAAFLGAYLEKIGDRDLLPRNGDDRQLLLDFHLLDKCLYELMYELDNRPGWIGIPLRGLDDVLGREA